MNPHRAHRDDDSGDQPPVTLTRGKRSITASAEGHVKQETNKYKAADKDIMQVYTLSRTESQMLRLPPVSKLLKSFCRMCL